MDILVNNGGQLTVLLSGVNYPCNVDADCPSQAVCAVKRPWSAIQPGQCVCSIDFSRTGPFCNQTSDVGFGMFGLILVTLALSIIVLAFGCYDIYLMKKAKLKFTFTAVQTSLLFLTTGALLMFISQLSLIGETFATLVLTPRGGGKVARSPTFFTFTNICVAATLFFTQLGMLNVCLVWHEVTDIRARFAGNVRRYRTAVLVIAIIYFIVYVVLIGLDKMVILAYASLPGFALIIAGYVNGYFKLVRASKRKRLGSNAVVRTSATSNPVYEAEYGLQGLLAIELGAKPGSSNRLLRDKRKEQNLKKKLRNIANIAISLFCFGTLTVVMVLVAAGLNGDQDTPFLSVTSLLYRASFICLASCLATVMIYVHQQVCVMVGKKSRMLTSQSSIISARYSSKSMKKKKSVGAMVKNYDEKTGMSEILKRENGELRTRFTEFVRSKYADEPLVFYDACTKYQETAKQGNRAIKGKNFLLIKLGHHIVDKFIKDDSAKWVNISDDIRKDILKVAGKDEFNEHTFDKAKVMAFELLKQNFYQQFVKMLQEEDEMADEEEEPEKDEEVIDVGNVKDLNV